MPRCAFAAVLILFLASPCASQNLDIQIFRGINNLQDPEKNGFTEYLDYTSIPTFAAVPVGFSVVGLATGDQAVLETGLMSFTAQATTLGLTVLFKELVDRPRPFDALPDVLVKHRWSATGSSFPSGHTSQAFAIATILSLKWRKTTATIPLFAWAVAIGYGRVLLGVHYPTDILGGAIIGIVGGFTAWSLRSETARIASRAVASQEVGSRRLPQTEVLRIQIPF